MRLTHERYLTSLKELDKKYRELAVIARKKDAQLKTLCDRAILKIRENRNLVCQYKLEQSKSGNKSNDNINDNNSNYVNNSFVNQLCHEMIIRPLIICWSNKSIKLQIFALEILQSLLSLDCISPIVFTQILLSIRALLASYDATNSQNAASAMLSNADSFSNIDKNIQIKIVQMVMQVPNSQSWTMGQDFLTHLIYICFYLSRSKDASIKQTSLAALQQIMTHALEHISTEMTLHPKSHRQHINDNNNSNDASSQNMSDIKLFHKIFHDLCCLANPIPFYLFANNNSNNTNNSNFSEASQSHSHDNKTAPQRSSKKQQQHNPQSPSTPSASNTAIRTSLAPKTPDPTNNKHKNNNNNMEEATTQEESHTNASTNARNSQDPKFDISIYTLNNENNEESPSRNNNNNQKSSIHDGTSSSASSSEENDGDVNIRGSGAFSLSNIKNGLQDGLLLLDINFTIDYLSVLSLIEVLISNKHFHFVLHWGYDNFNENNTINNGTNNEYNILSSLKYQLTPLICQTLQCASQRDTILRNNRVYALKGMNVGLAATSSDLNNSLSNTANSISNNNNNNVIINNNNMNSPTTNGFQMDGQEFELPISTFHDLTTVAKVIVKLISKHYRLLVNETEKILMHLLRLLESRDYPQWTCIIALEVLRHLLKSPNLLKFFYVSYDMNDECENKVFGSLIHALGRFITEITSLRGGTSGGGSSAHAINSESSLSHSYNSNYDGRQWSSKRFENSKFFTFLKTKNSYNSSKSGYASAGFGGLNNRDSNSNAPPPGASDRNLQIALTVDCFVSFVEGLGVVCNVSDQNTSNDQSKNTSNNDNHNNNSNTEHKEDDTEDPTISTPRVDDMGAMLEEEDKIDDSDPTLPISEPMSPRKMIHPGHIYNNNNNNNNNMNDKTGTSDSHNTMGASASTSSLFDINVTFDIKHMIEVIWRPLQAALSHMLNYSMFETQYQQLLSIYCTMSRICGKTGLQTPLQSFLKSMSSHALPNPFAKMPFSDILVKVGNSCINNSDIAGNNINAPNTLEHSNKSKSGKSGGVGGGVGSGSMNNIVGSNGNGNMVVGGSGGGGLSPVGSNKSMTDDKSSDILNETGLGAPNSGAGTNIIVCLTIKNVCTMHALVNIAQGLGSVLGGSWTVILETFEKLDFIFHRMKWCLINENGTNNTISTFYSNSGGITADFTSNSKNSDSYNYENDNNNNYNKKMITVNNNLGNFNFSVYDISMNNDRNNKYELLSSDSHWNDETRMLDGRLQQLFENSKFLNNDALCELLSALGNLTSSSLAGLATIIDANATTKASGDSTVDPHHSSKNRSVKKHGNVRSSDRKRKGTSDNKDLHDVLVDKVKSFALRKFVETIQVNIDRLDIIWDDCIAHLTIVMNNSNATLRHFGIYCLIEIQKQAISYHYQKQTMQEGFEHRLLKPYIQLFGSKYNDTRERVIRAVRGLLESVGEYITNGWPTMLELLHCVPQSIVSNHDSITDSRASSNSISISPGKTIKSGGITGIASAAAAIGKTNNNNVTNNSMSVNTAANNTQQGKVTLPQLKLAFDDIRLIASDYLDCLPDYCIIGLIRTVGLFGKQTMDNNISYSSISLLWKISDYITLITTNAAKKAAKLAAKQNTLVQTSDGANIVNISDSDEEEGGDGNDDGNGQNSSINAKKKRVVMLADGLQVSIFTQLQALCVDGRSDVRNSAIQTIFSAMVAYASANKTQSLSNSNNNSENNISNSNVNLTDIPQNMRESTWIKCIDTLTWLLQHVVVNRTRLNFEQDRQMREKLSKREYRAFKKKWNETETHCVQGCARISKMFISKLHHLPVFASFWKYYLESIINLLDLNCQVANVGIQCLQEIAKCNDFILACSKDGKYWNEIIECYQSMVHAIARKELNIAHLIVNEMKKNEQKFKQNIINDGNKSMTTTTTTTSGITGPASMDDIGLYEREQNLLNIVCLTLIESISDLLNPEGPARKLFSLQQIESSLNSLDSLINNNDLSTLLSHSELHSNKLYAKQSISSLPPGPGQSISAIEILDVKLIRLKAILNVYQQLPPMSDRIAKPVILKITKHFEYMSKCCNVYHYYQVLDNHSESQKAMAKSGISGYNNNNSNNNNNNTNNVVSLSSAEKSLLKKIERTMNYFAEHGLNLLLEFYSIHIPIELRMECFELVINGISKILDPMLCPINVVKHAVSAFERCCKIGLPTFAKQCAKKGSDNSENNGYNNYNNNNDNDEENDMNAEPISNGNEMDGMTGAASSSFRDKIGANVLERMEHSRLNRVWKVLGDIIEIAFGFQHHRYMIDGRYKISNKKSGISTLKINSVDAKEQHKNLEQIIDLKMKILSIALKHILPHMKYAPFALKQRIILLLNSHSSSEWNGASSAASSNTSSLNNSLNASPVDIAKNRLNSGNDESSVIFDHSVWSHQTKLSQACLTALFRICQRIEMNFNDNQDSSVRSPSVTPPANSTTLTPIMSPIKDGGNLRNALTFDSELSQLAYKLLIPKICDILDCFIEDSKKHESLQTALPFHGKQEILHILKLCKNLTIDDELDRNVFGDINDENDNGNVNVNVNDNDKNKLKPLKSRLTRKSSNYFDSQLKFSEMTHHRAHLFRIYPILCKLIKVNDSDVKLCLFDLFQLIGSELGLMTR